MIRCSANCIDRECRAPYTAAGFDVSRIACMARLFIALVFLTGYCLSPVMPWLNRRPEPVRRRSCAELIAVNTAPSGGNDMRPGSRRAGASTFEMPGLPKTTSPLSARPRHLPNLVVRYRSANPTQKPLLLMAHLDVVEALPDDWTMNPFSIAEKDGYYYGRGTTDNKAGAAMLIANLIRFKLEGFEANRDLIVMLTADEESSGEGAQLLVNEYRDLIDAEFALNTDGGSVLLKDNQPRAFVMQTSEKIYASFRLEALDPGGHSSRPRGDSAISRLARMLADLYAYRFPIDLNETTAAFFKTWKELAPPTENVLIDGILLGEQDPEFVRRLDDAPYYNALARTTCVATQISGGHAENALPQTPRQSSIAACYRSRRAARHRHYSSRSPRRTGSL